MSLFAWLALHGYSKFAAVSASVNILLFCMTDCTEAIYFTLFYLLTSLYSEWPYNASETNKWACACFSNSRSTIPANCSSSCDCSLGMSLTLILFMKRPSNFKLTQTQTVFCYAILQTNLYICLNMLFNEEENDSDCSQWKWEYWRKNVEVYFSFLDFVT